MKNNEIFQLVVRAIIKNKDGDILMVKRAKNPGKDKWVLPGGKIEFGEPSQKAIIREVREELNLNFSPKKSFYKEDFKSVPGYHCLVIHFLGNANGKITLKNDENTMYKYISIKNIKKSREIGFDHQEVLLKWI